uniref:Uncharacterized protein n=1 Tax=Oryza sativa subsp. japonica TaxID=39947 RepID=Q2R8I9_ORYSJ|nr:hypothetical protein LOC_Os11g12030 [Oryza sativa Japonica Group]
MRSRTPEECTHTLAGIASFTIKSPSVTADELVILRLALTMKDERFREAARQRPSFSKHILCVITGQTYIIKDGHALTYDTHIVYSLRFTIKREDMETLKKGVNNSYRNENKLMERTILELYHMVQYEP